jgi:hypothetical protein
LNYETDPSFDLLTCCKIDIILKAVNINDYFQHTLCLPEDSKRTTILRVCHGMTTKNTSTIEVNGQSKVFSAFSQGSLSIKRVDDLAK